MIQHRLLSGTADAALITAPAGIGMIADVAASPVTGPWAVMGLAISLVGLYVKLYFQDKQAARTEGLPLLNAELARLKAENETLRKRNDQVVGELRVAEAMASHATVLLVEDAADLATVEARTLQLAGFRVRRAESVSEAIREFNREPPDTLAVDLKLPDGDGEAILRHAIASGLRCNLVVLTGETDEVRLAKVRSMGGDDVHVSIHFKPIKSDALIATCRPAWTDLDMPTMGAK